MNLAMQIETAFRVRTPPQSTVESGSISTPEQLDAIWFVGRNWRDISRADWESHGDAFYAFSPKAFVYFLPSILMVSVERPGEYFGVAESLIGILDRSPVVENWDEFLVSRLCGLNSSEYAAISEWLLRLSQHDFPYDSDGIARAFDTVQLLDKESGLADSGR